MLAMRVPPRLRDEKKFAVVRYWRTSYNVGMSTLSEIETAIDALPPADKQELLLFLAARLRGQAGELPPPRNFSREQLNAWITEDEAAMQQLRGNEPE